MPDAKRNRARDLARDAVVRGTPFAWFETLYAEAAGNPARVPWADLAPNPNLVGWVRREHFAGNGRHVLKVGCGLGDDAKRLAGLGFEVVAFDDETPPVRRFRAVYYVRQGRVVSRNSSAR